MFAQYIQTVYLKYAGALLALLLTNIFSCPPELAFYLKYAGALLAWRLTWRNKLVNGRLPSRTAMSRYTHEENKMDPKLIWFYNKIFN